MKYMENKNRLIGLISYNIHSDHMNYGAVLHTFAFQQHLKKCGIQSVVINYVPKMIEKKNFKYPILNVCMMRHPCSILWNLLNWGILGFFSNLRKYRKFQFFFKNHYIKTSFQYRHNELMLLNVIEDLAIDTYVCESDVIWKLYAKTDFDDVFFLNTPFAKGKIKVAYSPSIGSRPFDEQEQKYILTMTKDFKAVSCREREGSEYLSQLLNRDVLWVLDPTLLLDSNDYEPLIISPEERDYLLVYNCMVNDVQMLKETSKLAERLGLEMIEISNYNVNKIKFNHKVKTDVGIEEWLGYFKYANFVVCNAFHGCCFSVIFQKQFFLFQRDGSDYRMKSITEGLGLSERLIPYYDKKLPQEINPIDYNTVNLKLSKLKKQSFYFIKQYIL